MSAPLRFLTVVVIGWAAVRAGTLGALPGFTVSYAKPLQPPPVVATELPPLALGDYPVAAPQAWSAQAAVAPYPMPPVHAYRVPMPYYVPAYARAPAPSGSWPIAPRAAWSLPGSTLASATPFSFSPLPDLGGPVSLPAPGSTAAPSGPPRLDRWQMSSWALLRGAPSPGTLAAGGTLGGSQAGARVTYAFTRSLAASVRTTSPIGGSYGAEVAGGIRWAPLASLPLAITAERRQSISRFGGGRNDFALFVEGGLYRQPMPWAFNLDAYAQAGIVGIEERDMFVDGALAFTRPVHGRFSAGFGAWGGYQPGVYRIDAGPRVSVRVRDNIRAHVDWRQRIAGTAQPGSGPALTLAADF